MNLGEGFIASAEQDWLCPDITPYWQLAKRRESDQILLQSKTGNRCYQFDATEGYALRYFTGQFTIEQVQAFTNKKVGETLSSNFVLHLLDKLVALGILESPQNNQSPKETSNGPRLKSAVQWIHHPEGYWILRNPEDITFLQVTDKDKAVIERLGKLPLSVIASEYELSRHQLQYLLQLLTATGMIEGTIPAKRPKGKFTPLQLLSFKFPLFNPDPWLTCHIDKIRFIFTPTFTFILGIFISLSVVFGLSQQTVIVATGHEMWARQGASLMLPFALLIMFVVSIHELGHAFTLKHYGGIVPEIGLMFMCLMPGCYTNTTDAYCLVKRRQRVLVVAAGVLVQIIIWAVALWLWNFSNPNTWLHTTSYLLMVAALLTVALNLNPLTRFDGYYLAVALTGINNLRMRSFKFYAHLLTGKPIRERRKESWILATYAPFSLAYILLVFGHLLFWMSDWSLTNLPTTVCVLLVLWAIYFYAPNSAPQLKLTQSQNTSTSMTAANSNSANHRPPLKVMPPLQEKERTRVEERETVTSSSSSSPVSQSPSPTSSSTQQWLIAGVAVIGIGCLGLIQLPQSVSGQATLDSTPEARQTVTMPISGTVKEILASTNQTVQAGQAIALVESESLNQNIAEADIELERSLSAVASAQQQLSPLQAQFNEALVKVNATRQEADYVRQQLEMIKQGSPPPEILRLQSEQAGIKSEIAGFKGELALLEQRLKRYEMAFQDGALALNQWEDVKRQQQTLKSQIAEKETQIQAKAAQIAAIKQNLEEQLRRRNAEVDATVAQMQSAMRQVQAATAEVKNHERVAKKLQSEKSRQIQRQEDKVVRALTTGTIVTPNLDQLQHRYLEAGATLLQIVNLQQLTVNVQIRPEDAPFVKPGATVKFRPQGTGLVDYTGTVQSVSIDPVVRADGVQQPPAVTVRVLLNQKDELLRPGLQGYAHIEAGSLRLYEKVQREFVKLVPVGKFF